MQRDLMLSILSMDTYHCAYNQGVVGLMEGGDIGDVANDNGKSSLRRVV